MITRETRRTTAPATTGRLSLRRNRRTTSPTGPTIGNGGRPRGRWMSALALTAAAATSVGAAIGVLPLLYVLPVIGLLLAAAAGPDHGPAARLIAASRRNMVIGVLDLLAVALVVGQPQLLRPLVMLLGLGLYGLVASLAAMLAIALPLAMRTTPAAPAEGAGPARSVVLTKRNLILCLTVAITVATWYSGVGQSFVAIAVLVPVVGAVLVVTRLLAVRRGRVEGGLWRRPWSRTLRPHRLQLLNVLLLSALLGVAIRPGTYDVLRLDMTAGQYRLAVGVFVGCLAAFALMATVPLRRVFVGSNLLVAAGSVFLAVQLVTIYRPAAGPVTIVSPLADEWYVGQGGHAELVNYHQVTSSQADALDILRLVDGRTHRPGSTELSSYYIYGAAVLAPADGVITYVVDGHPDQQIGSADHRHQAGNQVVLDVGGGRYVMIAHMHPGSIRVRVGDRVRAGQQIGQVGNSGNTAEPHIHIQAQNQPLSVDDVSAITDPGEFLRTAHTYPLVFRNMTLTRDGVTSTPSVVDPRRGDLLRPVG
jgi:Peptidase family M23